jgi:hypothetical protein
VTERAWPLRQARAMRCSSFAGFHGRSMLITALAACRFRPTLLLSVERNSRQAGSFLNRLISARRWICDTDPVCHAASNPISPASPRTIASMRSHSEKMIALRPGSCKTSSRIPRAPPAWG